MSKIFIVEDNQEIARMYERAFRLGGHEVSLAHDGESALRELLAAKEVPAAVVLDIMMPHMNGLDLLGILKKDERYKQVPVVVLTNSFFKEDSERFMAAGASMYLVKIDNQSKDVVEKIESLIN